MHVNLGVNVGQVSSRDALVQRFRAALRAISARFPVEYVVEGEPISLPDARALALDDRFQFQCWATGLVAARVADPKRGADKGIDGHRFFHDEASGKTKQVLLSVKSGSVGVRDVRDLRAVVDREKAEMGALLTLEQPTQPMRTEAADGGFYVSPVSGSRHPRLQILTIEALLGGAKLDLPESRRDVTFRKAEAADTGERSLPLFESERSLIVERKEEPTVPRRPTSRPASTQPKGRSRPKRRK